MLKVRILAGIISLLLLIVIFEAIRRRKFMEKYALLWIFSGLIIFVFSIFPKTLFTIAEMLGLHYLTTLLLFTFLFLLLIIFYFSLSLSSHSEKVKNLTQEVGVLKFKIKELEKKSKNEK
jgi:hypothetical protein